MLDNQEGQKTLLAGCACAASSQPSTLGAGHRAVAIVGGGVWSCSRCPACVQVSPDDSWAVHMWSRVATVRAVTLMATVS